MHISINAQYTRTTHTPATNESRGSERLARPSCGNALAEDTSNKLTVVVATVTAIAAATSAAAYMYAAVPAATIVAANVTAHGTRHTPRRKSRRSALSTKGAWHGSS